MNISVFDAADYLETEEEIINYLNMAAQEDDPKLFIKALRTAARAHGMVDLAQKANMPRESLYRALSESGNPNYLTLRKIMAALGLSFCVSKPAVS